MRIYFDVYDVPDHYFGRADGIVDDIDFPDIGSVVGLGLVPSGLSGESKLDNFEIEAVLNSPEQISKEIRFQLSDLVLNSSSEALELMDALEATGRFRFFEFD